MEVLRLGKSVQSVVQLQKDSSGRLTPVVIYQKPGRKKKKGSTELRPLDRALRRFVTAQQSFASSYLSRHDRSNRKKKDGWIEDIVPNVTRAAQTGKKKLRVKKLLPV